MVLVPTALRVSDASTHEPLRTGANPLEAHWGDVTSPTERAGNYRASFEPTLRKGQGIPGIVGGVQDSATQHHI